MKAAHDEESALKSVARIGRVDTRSKTLEVKDDVQVGIGTWGKIDYLTNYKGWKFVWIESEKTKAQKRAAALEAARAEKH